MIQVTQSSEIRTPTPDDTNEGKIVYIALLERRLLYYMVRDVKMRAALELATGVPYDTADFSEMTFEDMQEMIAQDMARGLNLSIQEARVRVSDNKSLSNP